MSAQDNTEYSQPWRAAKQPASYNMYPQRIWTGKLLNHKALLESVPSQSRSLARNITRIYSSHVYRTPTTIARIFSSAIANVHYCSTLDLIKCIVVHQVVTASDLECQSYSLNS